MEFNRSRKRISRQNGFGITMNQHVTFGHVTWILAEHFYQIIIPRSLIFHKLIMFRIHLKVEKTKSHFHIKHQKRLKLVWRNECKERTWMLKFPIPTFKLFYYSSALLSWTSSKASYDFPLGYHSQTEAKKDLILLTKLLKNENLNPTHIHMNPVSWHRVIFPWIFEQDFPSPNFLKTLWNNKFKFSCSLWFIAENSIAKST